MKTVKGYKQAFEELEKILKSESRMANAHRN